MAHGKLEEEHAQPAQDIRGLVTGFAGFGLLATTCAYCATDDLPGCGQKDLTAFTAGIAY
jgi:hypothetical protein